MTREDAMTHESSPVKSEAHRGENRKGTKPGWLVPPPFYTAEAWSGKAAFPVTQPINSIAWQEQQRQDCESLSGWLLVIFRSQLKYHLLQEALLGHTPQTRSSLSLLFILKAP